jgi:hypothetical protein
MLDHDKKQQSPIILNSTEEMKDKIGEEEMYRIHLLVVNPLKPDLLQRWEEGEKEDTKRFIIFYPKEPRSDQSKYKIGSMLSGVVTGNSDKKIYTVINTASEEKREGNATKLLENLAILIGEGNEIRGSLNLKLSSDTTLQKLDKQEKENIVKKLNGNFNFSSGVIAFNEGFINDENRIFIEEIKNAELWKAINFQFLSSFKEAPGLKFKLEVGSDTGDIILVPEITITNEIIKYVNKKELDCSLKNPRAELVKVAEQSK